MTKDNLGKPIPQGEVAPVGRPQRISRYRIEKVLGQGGFGIVYLARDEQLDRDVAVKVPHPELIARPEDAEAYLAEARTVASLDHPGIVPVYDVGSTEDCPCYVVSKYVQGTDLSLRVKTGRLTYRNAAELVAAVADALHYAHKRGVVHRDVKPGNILIDGEGKPFIVDFGLALREDNVVERPMCAGTPAYMSPEQARGEGHRVDGRSDIFSLGVVFYRLLVGRRPFRGASDAEVLDQVTRFEPRPLRQYDEKLPKELERICHRAMAKRASERYSTATDMADDLRLFLAEQTKIENATSSGGMTQVTTETPTSPPLPASEMSATASLVSMKAGSVDSQPMKIVPKGLRSFNKHDAEFFLELLPGPRDRNGLPDSLRFWKTRIEESDPDNTFPIGLVYGPSGCGKSSLIKAGLMPRLSEDVIAVYIEATPDETEARLLNGLRKHCPALDENLSLKNTLAALRRGQGIPVGSKVVIFIDQFEQWLHAMNEGEDTDLVQALRQCDGGRVQCVVMVRDDFWMAATRFMRELEVRLVEAHNSAAVDLFPVRHAEKVLAEFGRAFGTLPGPINDVNREQKDFLKKSVAGLAEDGKIICVRLALFAEMMKGREWTGRTLKEVGGTTGIGVTFLEETFSASTAPPEHRYHQKAARAALRDLLPDSGTDIKGSMRSHAELLEASSYGSRPRDFDGLIQILDREIRLITPTDPEGKVPGDESVGQTRAGQQYFQLTHDYLVHSLREWLTSKQKETRQGRAELKLFDTSVTWNARPENRFLPSWWENVVIRLFTSRKKWTASQRKMMSRAGRVHGIRSLVTALLLVAVVVSGVTFSNATRQQQRNAEATRLVEGLLQADTSQVNSIIENLSDYQQLAKDDLSKAFTKSSNPSNAKLHAALALLPEDESVLPFLKEQLLHVLPAQFEHVRDLLDQHKSHFIDDYWNIARDGGHDSAYRFQAACALASFDADNRHWQDGQFRNFLAGHLVAVLPSELLPWRNALHPVKEHLSAPLGEIYRDDSKDVQVRGFATDTLADYLSNDAEKLFELLADANEKQFGPMFSKLSDHRERAIALGAAEVARTIGTGASEPDKESLAMRQANVAVMLLRMNASDLVWPLLKHGPDPRVRTYFIHWLRPRGGDPAAIVARFEQETDVTIQRALLLCLGEFDKALLPPAQRKPLIARLLTVYQIESDAGLHASAEWLLRKWGQSKSITGIDNELQQNEEQLSATWDNKRQWYLNSQGQTYVILEGGEFRMGSPESETGRNPNETIHQRRIGRRFAISTKEVTRGSWRDFNTTANVWGADQDQLRSYIYSDDSPMVAVTWYEAAQYCNWLSEQEGIPEDQWCYEVNKDRRYGPGMRAKDNFWELTGYRLPTESEWEFACRAGAETSRYYGESEKLLSQYAWYQLNSENRTWPAASLKPNDFGLFDMQGNAYEWCFDRIASYPDPSGEPAADAPATDAVSETVLRMWRGGSYGYRPFTCRSAGRANDQPTTRSYDLGFRPARTWPLSQ